MIVFFSAEYVKAVGYLVSGFAVTRIWFAKEISFGKRLIALLEAKAKQAETVIKTDVKKVESAVINEAKKL
jgi:hypothetical protein